MLLVIIYNKIDKYHQLQHKNMSIIQQTVKINLKYIKSTKTIYYLKV